MFHSKVSPPSIINILFLTYVPVASVIKDKIHILLITHDLCMRQKLAVLEMLRLVEHWCVKLMGGQQWSWEGVWRGWESSPMIISMCSWRLMYIRTSDFWFWVVYTYFWTIACGGLDRWYVPACLQAIYQSAGVCFRRQGGISAYVSIYT